MSAIDDRLRSGLAADDEAFLKSLDDEPGLFEQMGATLHGSMKYWTALVLVFTFLIFAAVVWCSYNAFQAGSTKETVLWAAFAVAGLNGIGLLKMWVFMRMNHLGQLKEIKRLQMAVASLKAS